MSVAVHIPPSEHWCGSCCVFHLGSALCPWADSAPAPGVPIVGPYPSASLRLPAPSLPEPPCGGHVPDHRCSTCHPSRHRHRAPGSLDCAECIADHAASLALAPETVRPS